MANFLSKFKDPKFLLKIALIALIYFVAAKFGLSLSYSIKQVSLVWPPTGFSLAALLIFGLDFWPAIFLGAFFANITTNEPLLVAFFISIGNTLEALVGSILLKKYGFNHLFGRVKDVVYFIIFAAFLSTAISATIGAVSLILGGITTWGNFFSVWFNWWSGDLLGNIVFAPAILVWAQVFKFRFRTFDIVQGILLFIIILLISLSFFTGTFPNFTYDLQVQFKFLLFPLLIWASYKFKQKGSTLAVLLISAVAVWGAITESGPFIIAGNPEQTLLYMGIFIATIALTFMVFSVIIEQRDAAELFAKGREKRFSALLENSFDGLILIDAKAVILYASPSITRILGYKPEELIGINGFDIIYSEDKAPSTFALGNVVANPGKTVKIHNRLILKNKEVHWMEVEGKNLLGDPDVSAIVINFRDINDRMQLDQVKGEFVSLSAHQLRSPLSIIRWYTESLVKVGELPDKVRGYINEIYSAVLGMNETVNLLLGVSRFELGTVNISESTVNLVMLVKEIFADKTSTVKNKNIQIIDETGASNVPEIVGDAKLAGVVIENLVSNALKYTPAGGKISYSLTPFENNILFKISDSGIGIPKEDQAKIFTKLFRASNVKKVEPSGLGLGLYLIKLIMALKGGRIWFESIENKGTTFFVEFPKKTKTNN